MTIIRTVEEVVSAGGWTQCGCGIPNRARWQVHMLIGKGSYHETRHVDWYACADHLTREEPDRMLNPSLRSQGFTVLECTINEALGRRP